MASRPKRRAVGNGSPAPRDEEEEEDEVEDEDEDDEDSDKGEDEEDEIINERWLFFWKPSGWGACTRGKGCWDLLQWRGHSLSQRSEEVNIEFEAYSISDNDYDGIKKLLQQLFLKAPVNTAELTDLLIQQNHIGSVIKQSVVSEDSDDDVDEDEIFGFISLLNLTERKGTPCAEQIKEWILRLCEKNCGKGLAEQLGQLLSDAARPVGFLLSERFVNVPPQIALPLHQQLQKELAEAHRTNKPCGKCHFYLLISKTFVEAGKSNSKKKWSDPKKEELMFANAEEEFFYEKALLKFSYPEYLLPWQQWLAFHLHSQIHRMLRWTWRAVGQEETPT
uniref:BRCA2 and CDKN1A-interacting protein n=1 Tax=Sus scrofa TaxID=9823 RepID=A0A8D0MV95_PIG